VTIVGQVITHRILHLYIPPGADVAEVQNMLQALGYYTGPINRIYDVATQSAVKRFQRDYQLNPDGVVGPQTAVKLQAAYDIARGDVSP
jgi:L,D-transpeptidase ErfK/SrfK